MKRSDRAKRVLSFDRKNMKPSIYPVSWHPRQTQVTPANAAMTSKVRSLASVLSVIANSTTVSTSPGWERRRCSWSRQGRVQPAERQAPGKCLCVCCGCACKKGWRSRNCAPLTPGPPTTPPPVKQQRNGEEHYSKITEFFFPLCNLVTFELMKSSPVKN